MKNILILCLLLPSLTQAINVTLNPFDDACGNGTGSIVANISGGSAPYLIVWDPAPAAGQGTSVITGLFAGTYTITVTDAQGDEVTATATVNTISTLLPGNVIGGSATSCNMQCNGSGDIQTNTWSWGGQPPYAVNVSNGGTGQITNSSLHVQDLCPGTTYTATVTDALGCASIFSGIEVTNINTPVLQNIDLMGACEFGSNGTAVLTFDQSITLHLNSFGGVSYIYYSEMDGTLIIEDLAPGYYSGIANPSMDMGGCGALVDFTIPISPDPCGTISGMVHVDLDGDCIMNGDDVHFPYSMIQFGLQDYGMTLSNGTYSTEVFYGDHAINVTVPDYSPICPTVLPTLVTVDATTPDVVLNIAMEPLIGPDIMSICTGGVPRPGFPMSYSITARNNGPYAHAPFSATFTYDPLLALDWSSIPPDVNTPGYLEFSFAGMSAWEQQSVQLTFDVPADPLLIGTFITATSTVLPVPADAVPVNDSYSITQTIVGAYDPNDKLARTSSGFSDEHFLLDQDEYIDYTIRFQNTGNAAAEHVYLIDTISSDLDLGSLQILAASHEYEAQLLPHRVLRFDMPEIMLPDSASDLIGSQGFVTFRLRPINTVMAGDVLENFADIYFDFNPPIRTNTSQLLVELNTGSEGHPQLFSVMVFPNPATDQIEVRIPNDQKIISWRILDAVGRSVDSASNIHRSAVETIDIQKLAPGAYFIEVAGAEGCATVRMIKSQ